MYKSIRRSGRHLKQRILKEAGIRQYNITSSNQTGFTWFRIAKCGTRSMLATFQEHCELDIDASDVSYFRFQHSGKFKFCILRNPWDRLVSCYQDKVVGKKIHFEDCWGKDFDYFIRWCELQNLETGDVHIRRQTALFPTNDIDHIGRFENFRREFDFIMNETLNLNARAIKMNASRHEHYSTYYTAETQKIVDRIYAEDIDFGSYTFQKNP